MERKWEMACYQNDRRKVGQCAFFVLAVIKMRSKSILSSSSFAPLCLSVSWCSISSGSDTETGEGSGKVSGYEEIFTSFFFVLICDHKAR